MGLVSIQELAEIYQKQADGECQIKIKRIADALGKSKTPYDMAERKGRELLAKAEYLARTQWNDGLAARREHSPELLAWKKRSYAKREYSHKAWRALHPRIMKLLSEGRQPASVTSAVKTKDRTMRDPYFIAISSPSDVPEERAACERVIQEWNTEHGDYSPIILQPLRWERDVGAGLTGQPAQKTINEKMVKKAALLIGIFGSRIGTPTENAISGTVEEIQEQLKAGKTAIVFFLDKDVSVDTVDTTQIEKLREFKAWCQQQGILGPSKGDFAYNVKHQIEMHLWPVISGMKHKDS
ncbi:MAG: DUF4062 domain-containing protein [Treponematales bacterium]